MQEINLEGFEFFAHLTIVFPGDAFGSGVISNVSGSTASETSWLERTHV
jgi:hypothetical protein